MEKQIDQVEAETGWCYDAVFVSAPVPCRTWSIASKKIHTAKGDQTARSIKGSKGRRRRRDARVMKHVVRQMDANHDRVWNWLYPSDEYPHPR